MKTKKSLSPRQYLQIDLTRIDPPKNAMRRKMDEEALQLLKNSIKKLGLMQPIVVKTRGKKYEIVAGHRRFRALQDLGKKTIDAVVLDDHTQLSEIQTYHENCVRENVPVVDEAEWLLKVKKQHKLSSKQIAELLGRSEAYVSDRMSVIEYPEHMRDAVNSGELSFSSARELNRIENENIRNTYIEHAVRGGINQTTARQWRVDANSAQPTMGPGEPGNDPSKIPAPLPTVKLACAACENLKPLEETILIRFCKSCAAEVAKAK